MPRRLCGDDPVKSMSISSPLTVTVATITIGSSNPSLQTSCAIDAVGEGADGLAQGALGAGDDLVGQRIDTLQAELVHHRQQGSPADVVAGGLRVEIAHRLVRETDVGADDLQQLLVRLAAVEELRHRDAQPLLVDLVRLTREDLTADVRRVTEVAEVADDPAFTENRRDHREVVELAGGHPGVVGDQHVAGAERLRRIGGQQVAHAGGHRVDVARGAGQRLRHHLTARVEDAAGEVLRLTHHRAERGPHQRRLLLVGDGEEPVPEHLQRHRIEVVAVTGLCSACDVSVVMRSLDLHGQVSFGIDRNHRTWADDGGRFALLDDGGTGEGRTRSQPVAIVDWNVGHPALFGHVGPARAFARGSRHRRSPPAWLTAADRVAGQTRRPAR